MVPYIAAPPPPPLELCPDCPGKFEAKNLPLHKLQVHAPKTLCSSCQPPCNIPTQLMDMHQFYFHPPVPEEGEQEEVVLGDQCQLCDLRLPEQDMKDHLLVEHDVRVIEEEAAPVATPASKSAVKTQAPRKIECHHCQKEFSTQGRLEKHTEKYHLETCKICQVGRLVRENRLLKDKSQLEKTFSKTK